MNSLDLFPKLLWLLHSLSCSNIIFLPVKQIYIPRNYFDCFPKSSFLKFQPFFWSILKLDYWVFCCHSVSFWHFHYLPVLLAGHSPKTIISSLLLILLHPALSFSLGIASCFPNYEITVWCCFPKILHRSFTCISSLHRSCQFWSALLVAYTPHCFVFSLFLFCLTLCSKVTQVCWITFPEGSHLPYYPNCLSNFTAVVACRQLTSSWNLN